MPEYRVRAVGITPEVPGSSTPRDGQSWRVWAKVAGPVLPEDTLRFGGLFLGRALGMQKPPGPPADLKATKPEDAVHYVASGSFLQVTSPCWAWADIEAPTAIDAMGIMRSATIPLAATALSLYSMGPAYRFCVVGAVNLESGSSLSDWSRSAYVEGWESSTLSSARASELLAVHDVIEQSDSLSRSANLLRRAIDLTDHGTEPAYLSAALLAYYQSIECIARLIPYEHPSDFDQKQKEILSTLKDQLAADLSAREHRKCVTRADIDLKRLEANYTNLRVENSAIVMKFPDWWLPRFQQLSKLRNEKLGHGADDLVSDQIQEWFPDTVSEKHVYWLARTFLAGVVEWQRLTAWEARNQT